MTVDDNDIVEAGPYRHEKYGTIEARWRARDERVECKYLDGPKQGQSFDITFADFLSGSERITQRKQHTESMPGATRGAWGDEYGF